MHRDLLQPWLRGAVVQDCMMDLKGHFLHGFHEAIGYRQFAGQVCQLVANWAG